MYAIIKTGGKQYRVAQGDTLKVEMLDSQVGDKVFFEEVLMIGNGDKFQIGAPLLKGAKVQAEILNQGRGEKIRILKFRRRKHHMKHMGHRQNYTEVKIIGINE